MCDRGREDLVVRGGGGGGSGRVRGRESGGDGDASPKAIGL